MPSMRDIRRRIRSIQNTGQITKAMEMVAASKLRRVQAQALSSRPYSDKMWEMLRDLAARVPADAPPHPLLQRREVRRIGLVLVTPDRGLCGPLNSNLVRHAASFMLERQQPVSIIAVGRRGRDWMVRRGRQVVAEFTQLGDRPAYLDTVPIARVVMDGFLEGSFDEVYLVYARFITTLTQEPVLRRLLPVSSPEGLGRGRAVEYIYEPSPQAVLAMLLPRFVEVGIYHAVLESVASEQSARMVAMRNATDNASEIVGELTLNYNKTRQNVITKELLEIASGAEALRQAG